MLLIAVPAQVDWQALRNYLGDSHLTKAKPEEEREVTGYEG
jgi:prolyl-tRNA editing enzyme YbaK/EbsC (Cys-tRNA(Pro) deacylase)